MSFIRLVLLCALSTLVLGDENVTMRWCITSKENEKCQDFLHAIAKVGAALNKTINFECVVGSEATDCMKKIEQGAADLITLDGGEIYLAGKDHDMVPVVGENYGDLYETSYYAVAVIRKNNSDEDFDIKKLKGKKSCHTGAGKTAGWNVPIGFLLSKKYMKQDSSCNQYKSAGNFFEESCVPDSMLLKYNPNNINPQNLCDLCQGGCKSDGRFADYSGAFKCMAEGVGDVAFIKHSTVREMVDVDPSFYGTVNDYQYLCKKGGRGEIGQHLQCNLARVPSHAVMTKRGNNIADYQQILLKASEMFGINQTDPNEFQLFNSTIFGGKDHIFKDSTTRLTSVGEKNSYQSWLGDDYLADIEALSICEKEDATGTAHMIGPMVAIVFLSFSLAVSAVASG